MTDETKQENKEENKNSNNENVNNDDRIFGSTYFIDSDDEQKSKSKAKHVNSDENSADPLINVPNWLQKNSPNFQPPICNKLMYSDQLKIMFVGGPNTRKDFHIDCGEEFFYQIKGNMALPIYQEGKRKLVRIREGEVFLLPACIPHSPQRPEQGSIGLVVERERLKTEVDALRFYVSDFDTKEKDNTRVLWEKWFQCTDLGTQLVPIVESFHASAEFKNRQPSQTSVCIKPPVELDVETVVAEPINLMAFIEGNRKELRKHKRLDIYSGTQTLVRVMCGPLEFARKYHQETWIYILQAGDDSNIKLSFDFPSRRQREYLLHGDSVIVKPEQQFRLFIKEPNTLVMIVSMDSAFPEPDLFAIPSKYDREKKTRKPWENMKKKDPHYHQRMLDRGATKEDVQNIDCDVTLDTQ